MWRTSYATDWENQPINDAWSERRFFWTCCENISFNLMLITWLWSREWSMNEICKFICLLGFERTFFDLHLAREVMTILFFSHSFYVSSLTFWEFVTLRSQALIQSPTFPASHRDNKDSMALDFESCFCTFHTCICAGHVLDVIMSSLRKCSLKNIWGLVWTQI